MFVNWSFKLFVVFIKQFLPTVPFSSIRFDTISTAGYALVVVKKVKDDNKLLVEYIVEIVDLRSEVVENVE